MGIHYTSNPASDLGRIGYHECLQLQLHLVEMRKEGLVGNTLLFLEHDPPVYTIGRKSDPKNYPGIQVVKTGRGGDVTYHSPGQLVVYPIFEVSDDGRLDVRGFVKRIEGVVIDSLGALGYDTYVGSEEPGIWDKGTGKKVASVGMAIDGHVSYHGIAINISAEPIAGFQRIHPCGLEPSMMGYVDVDREELVNTLLKKFSSAFSEHKMVGKNILLDLVSRWESGTKPGKNQMSAIRS